MRNEMKNKTKQKKKSVSLDVFGWHYTKNISRLECKNLSGLLCFSWFLL